MEEIKATYGHAGPMLDRVISIFGAEAVVGDPRLNVGCGGNKIPGWINLDAHMEGDPDVVADLDTEMGGAEPGHWEVILASHVLEHVKDPVWVVYNLHRMLKPGGRLLVIVPHAFTAGGLANPFHRNYFTADTFVYFRKDTYDQPGTAGYLANEGRPIADWASVKVGMIPMPEWRNHPALDTLANRYVNVVSEVAAMLTKKGA